MVLKASPFSWRPALPPPSCVCSFLIYGRAGPAEAFLNTIDASLQHKGTAFTGMVHISHIVANYSNMCTKLLISFWAVPCTLSISTVALNVRQEKQVSVTHHTLPPKRIEYLEELRLVDLGFQMM